MNEHVRRLIDVLGADTSGAQQQDWSGIESELQVRLPADYKDQIKDLDVEPGWEPPDK